MDIFDLIETAKEILDRLNFIRFLKELREASNDRQQMDIARKYRVVK